MSDYSDGSGPIARRPRVGDSPAPVSGVVAIVLAVIAVVAGYLILRSITDGGSDDAGIVNPGGAAGPAAVTVPDSSIAGDSVPSLPPDPTPPPGLVVSGSTVIVANANGQGGSAGKASTVLENSAGFTVADPTDASSSTSAIETSLIYYSPADANAATVAASLNTVMGGALNVAEMPDPPPVKDGNLNDATVLLMLGTDFAEMVPGDLNLSQVPGVVGAPEITNPPTGTPTATPTP